MPFCGLTRGNNSDRRFRSRSVAKRWQRSIAKNRLLDQPSFQQDEQSFFGGIPIESDFSATTSKCSNTDQRIYLCNASLIAQHFN